MSKFSLFIIALFLVIGSIAYFKVEESVLGTAIQEQAVVSVVDSKEREPKKSKESDVKEGNSVAEVSSSAVAEGAVEIQAVPQKTVVTSSSKALIGGAFSLTDQNSNIVTDKNLEGKVSLVFFGFTHCPEVCPTALSVISQAMEQLGEDATKMQTVFITVDPERDTQEVMKEYIANFNPDIIGLTGSREDIKQVVAAYRVYVSKAADEEDPENYMMDHSGYIYIMDKNGEYASHLSHESNAEAIANSVRKIL